MFKNYAKLSLLLLTMIALYGCASKGITVQSYIEDKKRVDQDMAGNAGYLMGTPRPQAPVKTTRKMFVVEVAKEFKGDSIDGQDVVTKTVQEKASVPEEKAQPDQRDFRQSPKITLPSFDDVEPAAKATGSNSTVLGIAQQYKVEKDDTLQKISKKFYNSYGKWTKIYEANKEKISNPDHLKPGIVLEIPQ